MQYFSLIFNVDDWTHKITIEKNNINTAFIMTFVWKKILEQLYFLFLLQIKFNKSLKLLDNHNNFLPIKGVLLNVQTNFVAKNY